MMATTHAAAGVLAMTPLLYVAPDFAGPAALGALVGGALPDLDLFVGAHRRSLHYPVLGWVPAVAAAGVALVAPSTVTVALAGCLVAAALHALSDILGAGEEERPWEATSERAVYDHLRNRWWRPRRLIPYDGSPRDLLVLAVLSAPGLALFDGPIRAALVGMFVLSVGYTLFRKRMPRWLR